MTCVHLQQLFKRCQDQKLKFGGSDLIRVVCYQCGLQGVCPSVLMDEYDSTQPQPVIDTRPKRAEDSTM